MAGYSVTFTVVDQATKQIDTINRRIAQMRAPMDRLSKQMTRFADVSGLRKVAAGFDWIGKTAGTVLHTLTGIVPAMGAITGAASIAGMVKLVQQYANWSHELVAAADNIGTTTQKLQQFEDATRLAGGTAADMRDSLKGLHDNLADFNRGGASAAMTGQWANKLHINLKDANGQIRAADSLLPELLKKIAAMPDPADRAAAATALLGAGGDRLVESFRQSTKGLDDWMKDASRYKELTDDQKRSLQLFGEAQGRLGVQFDHMGQQISAMVARDFGPLLQHFSDFVDKHTPEILAAIDKLSSEFAAWLDGIKWENVEAGINKFIAALQWVWNNLDTIKVVAEAIAVLFAVKWVASIGMAVAALAPLAAALAPIAATIAAMAAGLAAGGIAGKMQAPMVDDNGRVIGNWGGKEPEAEPGKPEAPGVNPNAKIGKFFDDLIDRFKNFPGVLRPSAQRQSAPGVLPGGVTPAAYHPGAVPAVAADPSSGFWADMTASVTKGFEDAFDHITGVAGAVGGVGGGSGGGGMPGITRASYEVPDGGGGGGGTPAASPNLAGRGAQGNPGGTTGEGPGHAPHPNYSPHGGGPLNLPEGTVQRGAGITTRLASDLSLPAASAAGIVGNLQAESGLKAINEKNPLVAGSRGGFGWAQWTGPRRREFEAYAKANNLDPKSDEANYGFLVHELHSKQFAPMLEKLRNLKGPNAAADAAALVEKIYEGPAVSNAATRARFANQILAHVPPPGSTATAAAPPATVPGQKPVNGAVDVNITHKNPPPNSAVTATGSGAVNVAPVRVEQQDMASI